MLGPLYGALSGFIFGWLVAYVNPATSIGIFTFLAPTLAALMSGLVLFNRWKEAALILLFQIAVWLANPFAWYQLMPLILWQFVPVGVFIIVPPIRKWIVNSIVSANPKRLPIALWCLAWIARIGGDVATGNNIAVWILNWTGPVFYPFWCAFDPVLRSGGFVELLCRSDYWYGCPYSLEEKWHKNHGF